MSDPITLPGTIPGLLCPGMLCSNGQFIGRITMVYSNGTCAMASGGAIEWGHPTTIDLSDPLTLQATVAWCASKASGRAVGPHECIAHTFDGPPGGGRYVKLSYYVSAIGSFGQLQFRVDYTDETGIRGLAIAIRSVVIAICDGRIKVCPDV